MRYPIAMAAGRRTGLGIAIAMGMGRKRIGLALSAGLLAWVLAGPAVASKITFTFDPDDLVQLWSETPLPVGTDSDGNYIQSQQANPRRAFEQNAYCTDITDPSTCSEEIGYATFGNPDNSGDPGHPSHADDLDTYKDWAQSLTTPDVGLWQFSLTLRRNPDGYDPSLNIDNAADAESLWNWGERLIVDPDFVPTSTASDGWVTWVDVYDDVFDIYWWYGGSPDQDDLLINQVNDLGPFSFTADFREISDPSQSYADGTDIADGSDWRFWFGSIWLYHTDPTYASWEGYEGTLQMTAEKVPEPAALALLAAGLALIGALRRWRRTPLRAGRGA